jgi:16S rRNA processing protein RimM
MAYKCGILLGHIKKLSGYEGAVTVKLERTFSDKLPEMESVFLEIDGKPVPFLISELEYQGADLLKLTFEGYESAEKINEFAGSRVFLTTSFPEKKSAESPDDLEGFSIRGRDGKLIGSITAIVQNPGQLLLTIESPDHKEILIPFHEDFIVSFNKAKREIVMDLPEGLIEINQGNFAF